MSESHFDKYEHYNYDQDKAMYSGGSGKQRSKLEVRKIQVQIFSHNGTIASLFILKAQRYNCYEWQQFYLGIL